MAFHRLRIVPVNVMHDMPVVGFKTFGGIVGKPAFGFAINGDAVMIVKPISLPSPSVPASEHTSCEILHQTAVAHKDIGVVVDNLMVRPVELCA